jgi:hypothetical protein
MTLCLYSFRAGRLGVTILLLHPKWRTFVLGPRSRRRYISMSGKEAGNDRVYYCTSRVFITCVGKEFDVQ